MTSNSALMGKSIPTWILFMGQVKNWKNIAPLSKQSRLLVAFGFSMEGKLMSSLLSFIFLEQNEPRAYIQTLQRIYCNWIIDFIIVIVIRKNVISNVICPLEKQNKRRWTKASHIRMHIDEESLPTIHSICIIGVCLFFIHKIIHPSWKLTKNIMKIVAACAHTHKYHSILLDFTASFAMAINRTTQLM